MKEQTIQNFNVIFWNIVNQYDTSNTNIIRKIIHSFSVAEICFSIACKNLNSKRKRELAYFAGLFHDVGRFEQWKLYQTYNDKKSVDHGDLGADILNQFDSSFLNLSKEEKSIMVEAIKYHTKPYTFDNKIVLYYNDMIKNADAYSNVITTANGAQQMTVDGDGVTEDIYDKFVNLQPLWNYSPNTKLDRALMLTACSYYVKMEELRKEILSNNYTDIMYETFSQYLNNEDKSLYKRAIDELKNKYLTTLDK